MKKKLVLLLLCTALTFCFGVALHHITTPAQCMLCSSTSYHAPCLLNLSSGEIGELSIYDPHLFFDGQPTPYSEIDTFSFLSCCGLIGYRDTSNQLCSIDVPDVADRFNRSKFCSNCRRLLSPFVNQGFVIVDISNPTAPQILPIKDGAEYEIRCYSITVVYNTRQDSRTITVVGHLF